MNILHITAGASSSSACTRLHRAMINEGIESNILSGEISGDIEQSIEVNTDNMIIDDYVKNKMGSKSRTVYFNDKMEDDVNEEERS